MWARGLFAISVAANATLACVLVLERLPRVRSDPYYHQRISLFTRLPLRPIVFAGDSLVDNCEWSELLDSPVSNRGIGGETVHGLIKRAPALVGAEVNLVVLIAGINDLRAGESAEQVAREYGRLTRIMWGQNWNGKVFVISILPVRDHIADGRRSPSPAEISGANAAIGREIKFQGAIFLDIQSQFRDPTGQLDQRFTNDGLHLSGDGYSVLAAALRDVVEYRR